MATTIADKFNDVTDTASAVKAVKATATRFRSHLATGESRQVEAAYATWTAVQYDVIREGRKTKDSPEVEMEHAEYAALFDGGRGTVKSQIGLWIVMGYGLAVLNIDPESDLFKRLRKGLQFGAVKDGLRACKTTADVAKFVTDVLDKYVDENGEKMSKAARIEAGSGETPDPAREAASEKDGGGDAAVVLDSETAPAIAAERFFPLDLPITCNGICVPSTATT